MRAICAVAALCLAAAFVPSADALARARHHHAMPHAVPLPPERPDIESMFGIVRRTVAGTHAVGPDGLADRRAR